MGFLLIDQFALMSFSAAIEPLRAANILTGQAHYAWQSFVIDADARASTGLRFSADGRVGDEVQLDTLFVCAGGNPALFGHRKTLQWLRGLARQGVRLAGVSGGPFILARAGLLDGHRCTIHWEHAPAFVEAFPHLDLTGSLYEIDRDRLTCAGGIAALDMLHALIAEHHGGDLAAQVAEWFLQTQVRLGSGPQRGLLQDRFGVSDPRLARVLQAMEEGGDRIPSRVALATVAGVSVRQLERLFKAALGTSIDKQIMRFRLERARALLRQSGLSVMQVAVACGFTSASHFSRLYKDRYGTAPRLHRRL